MHNLQCSFMNMINFIICFSSMEQHVKGQYLNWDSINVFIKILLFSKLIKLDNLASTDNFLPAFIHRSKTYSSKIKFLSIITSNNFVYYSPRSLFPLFLLKLPIFMNREKKTTLVLIELHKLFSNHSIANIVSCSSLLTKESKFVSHA